MKIFIRCIGVVAITMVSFNIIYAHSMHNIGKKDEKKIDAEVKEINRRLEIAYSKENTDSILSFYNEVFTYLPEYKPTIYSAKILREFYTDWFKSVNIKAYRKNIYSVEDIKGYVLEIGNFILTYSMQNSTEKNYTGKYMVMWKRNISGHLKILSEAFGCDKYIDPESMPYTTVKVENSMVLKNNMANPKLLPQIEQFDKGVVKAVLTGDGEARANEFTQDGIYMPHFDPMQIGMNMLRPYMLKTYKPNVITYVKDTYREIFDMGEFVFLNGDFKVAFDNGTSKGNFEGTMLNLMKRGKDGRLLMYRQLAHN